MRIASDTGGTFTDLIVEDDNGAVRLYKSATVPDDPAAGVLAGLQLTAEDYACSLAELLDRCELIIYGTTHAINAVITGRTAKTAFLVTRGHPDILTLREGGRIEPFNHSVPYPKPYVPRSLTFEVDGRIDAQGDIVIPLDEKRVLEIAGRLKQEQVEAIAICLLWSIVNPEHENRVAAILSEQLPQAPITISHRLNPTMREYRRASATVIDASLKPVMSRYLGGLEQRLRKAGFNGRLLVLTSQGGAMDATDVGAAPIHAINSGPSMAPVAGKHYGRSAGHEGPLIVADTGGTTYDVSLVRGDTIPWTRETWIGEPYRGHMTGFPSIDIRSVGAGGGSIAWVDDGGVLHVGPQSAGAVPGPVCYDQGGELPTVTDTALLLGYLDADFFLGGAMPLNADRARHAISAHVAQKLECDVVSAARSVIDVVTENMVQAIESIAINQGIDPAESLLIGGGGAAGLNSVFVARRLGCRQVCFPDVGAALSAAGALISDLRSEYRTMHFTVSDNFDFDGVNRVLNDLRQQAEQFIAGAGAGSAGTIRFSAEARYPSQVWEIETPLAAGSFSSDADVQRLVEEFHRVHREIFSYADIGSGIEIVSWCANVNCRLRADEIGALSSGSGPGTQAIKQRQVYLPARAADSIQVLNFTDIEIEQPVAGPAIVETPHTSIVIDHESRFVRTASGNLLVNLSLE